MVEHARLLKGWKDWKNGGIAISKTFTRTFILNVQYHHPIPVCRLESVERFVRLMNKLIMNKVYLSLQFCNLETYLENLFIIFVTHSNDPCLVALTFFRNDHWEKFENLERDKIYPLEARS